MDERGRRVARNEIVFREVNERLDSLNRAFASVSERVSLVCECGDGSCTQQIEMSASEYDALRADPTQFVVVRGHEVPSFDEVVARGDGYDVIRKIGVESRRLATDADGD